jgi:radical SAM superfamily enzyme YgiQ (UPF0313 family)
MRILFVDNLLVESKNGSYVFDLQPHLGLISLIAVAETGGHQGMLYDPKLALVRGDLRLDESLYQEMACAIVGRSPDLVGMTTLGCNFICTAKVASYVRMMEPELPIVLGGPHATILDRPILERFAQFDAVVRGEAEETLLPLLEALPSRAFHGLRGVTYRHGAEVVSGPGAPLIRDLDVLPRPAYHCYPIQELDLPVLRVEAGRGCPFNCTFCSTASFFGRKYRLKSAERLCAELDHLSAAYGTTHFALTHDLFTVSRVKVREFCDAVSGRGYTWTCSARMDCVDADLLQVMYDSGCRSIYYGVESGSQRMQRVAEKRLDLGLFTPILDATRRVGMAATVSFITGYPEEDESDQAATLDMIGSCVARNPSGVNVQLHLLTPEPGTQLALEHADALAYDGHISDFNFPTLEPDDRQIMSQDGEVFVNHHYYLSKIPRRRHIFVTSLHAVLYQLGFPLLGHLLTRYDGSLSRFHSRMFDWAERASRSHSVDPEAVVDFLIDEWGAEHYLPSVVLYMFTAVGLARSGGTRRRKPGPPASALGNRARAAARRGSLYQLVPSAAVLRGIPDCPRILELITSSHAPGELQLPDTVRDDRGCFLLVLDATSGGAVRNYRVDSDVATLIAYFTAARTYREYAREFRSMLGASSGARTLFDHLLERGVIAEVAPTAFAGAPAGAAGQALLDAAK